MAAVPSIPAEPPPIEGVRRRRLPARRIGFHLTEAGPEDGRPVLLLHGWPQHHYGWRHLLADPPPGLRLIAPDLPGYGWSGPAPHRWEKEEVAQDMLALLDALELGGDGEIVLTGHDWGGFIGYLMVLAEPERFSSYLALNIAHPWNTFATFAPHAWRFAAYQPLLAAFGEQLMRRTDFVEKLALTRGVTVEGAFSPEEAAWFAHSYRDPVCARTARDTYRTFLLRELPRLALGQTSPRCTVPVRCVFGADDFAIHPSMAAAETADAEDYELELVQGCGHFIADERPELVRDRLTAIAAEFAPRAAAATAA